MLIVPVSSHRETLTALLSDAGFLAADEEAGELLASAAGDVELLDSFVRRRLTGEPLAWITGSVSFCGIEIHIAPGVYVPRPQSEPLARRALERLPATGAAIDLCTGSGAIARILTSGRPAARVVASDVDDRAVACAASNGVEAYRGDLFSPLPPDLEGRTASSSASCLTSRLRSSHCCSATRSPSSLRLPTTAVRTVLKSSGAS